MTWMNRFCGWITLTDYFSINWDHDYFLNQNVCWIKWTPGQKRHYFWQHIYAKSWTLNHTVIHGFPYTSSSCSPESAYTLQNHHLIISHEQKPATLINVWFWRSLQPQLFKCMKEPTQKVWFDSTHTDCVWMLFSNANRCDEWLTLIYTDEIKQHKWIYNSFRENIAGSP